MRCYRRRVLASCGLLLMLLPTSAWAATPTADYEVRFDATWSAATHPTGFPVGPHFSPLIGATHDSTVLFWELGQTASLGIERMAELGQTGELSNEILAQGAKSDVLIAGGDIPLSPGSVTVAFSAGGSHPFLTLVSMLAPSPDWFVGVSGLDLKNNGDWIESATVDLFVHDAGTDSGSTYGAPDQDTNPQDPITLSTSSPFDNGVPVGTYTITRTDAAPGVPAIGRVGWAALGSTLALLSVLALRRRSLRPRGVG
jgi:hypothetical protein